jgi:hypothetical protein
MRILLFLGCLLLCSCSVVKRKPAGPGDLYTQAQERPVTVHDGWLSAKTISYGDYLSTPRKTGKGSIAALTLIKNPERPFSFTLKGNHEETLIMAAEVRHITFPPAYKLPSGLNIEPPGALFFYAHISGFQSHPQAEWELIVKRPHYLELNRNKEAGVLRSPEEDIRITAHNRFGVLNAYEQLCYEFHYQGRPVAAVIPGGQPRVWISNVLPEYIENGLAAAIAALLLR